MTQAHSHVDAVISLRTAVLRFADDAEMLCREARTAAERVLAEITHEVQARRRAVDQARRALRACQSGEGNDCRGQAAALADAEERLARAQSAHRSAQRAVDGFDPRQQAFARDVRALARDAATLTGQQQSSLEDYLAGSGGSGGGSGFGGRGSSATTGVRGYPNGVQMVSLDLISHPFATVHGAGDFNDTYSPENLQWAFDALHEVVLPAIAAGQGADYFAARDQAENRVGIRSYSDTYAGFFGKDEAIRLNRQPDGSYTIGNGQHRIWVARRMGLANVPAILE